MKTSELKRVGCRNLDLRLGIGVRQRRAAATFDFKWATVPLAVSAATLLLAACGGGGDDGPDPVTSFAVDHTSVTQGQAATLSWSTSGAQNVTLSGVSATPSSTAVVAPAQTTTYTLSSTNASGHVFTRQVVVNVTQSTPLATVSVDPIHPGTPVPSGFLGFSHPWGQAQILMGDPAIGVNPIYRQLLKNIEAFGGGPLSIRVGGTVSDSTTAPNTGTVRPFAQLATDLTAAAAGYGATFILGINFAASDVTLASVQTAEYVKDMPAGSLQSIELGNEPDVYVRQKVRTAPYTMDVQYAAEVKKIASGILSNVPNTPLFTAPSTVSFPQAPLVENATPFLTTAALTNFLNSEGSFIQNVSQHSYIGISADCGGTTKSGLLLQRIRQRIPWLTGRQSNIHDFPQ